VENCTQCGELKDASEFYGDRSKASGRRSMCRVCDLARSRLYYAKNRARVIARVRARNKT
jgi:hypothetical protein